MRKIRSTKKARGEVGQKRDAESNEMRAGCRYQCKRVTSTEVSERLDFLVLFREGVDPRDGGRDDDGQDDLKAAKNDGPELRDCRVELFGGVIGA